MLSTYLRILSLKNKNIYLFCIRTFILVVQVVQNDKSVVYQRIWRTTVFFLVVHEFLNLLPVNGFDVPLRWYIFLFWWYRWYRVWGITFSSFGIKNGIKTFYTVNPLPSNGFVLKYKKYKKILSQLRERK